MAPSATMLGSAAYGRMRAENQSEFVPKSVFFTRDKGSESDRASSFWVKAALVYESITGKHVDDGSKQVADNLLEKLAENCSSEIHPTPEKPGDPAPGQAKYEKEQVSDGIFLVVGFLSRLKKAMGDGSSRDAVDESFKSTHMQDIVTDVIKLENQLPLELLLDVVGHVEEAVDKTLKAPEFNRLQEHFKSKKYELGFKPDKFPEVVDCFCWYYSPFFNEKAAAQQDSSQPKKDADKIPAQQDSSQSKKGADKDPKMKASTLLEYLHASLAQHWPVVTGGAGGDAGGKTSRMPTARKLRRSGVRFGAVGDGSAVFKFIEISSTLSLPALVYDFKLATVARNLLASEYEEQSKPVTRYFQMMNELVEEVADARILRRAGVLRGASRGAREVHELIKKIDGYATYPSVFTSMDLEIDKVKQFHDKRMKNFLVRYRPAVIWASSLAAASVVAVVAARKKKA